MKRNQETEVLVVGAGPVGMMTALLLAERGVRVLIIDNEQCTAAHSHACVLHPRTLQLLDRVGLIENVLRAGRRIDNVAFYDDETRQAEMRLSELPVKFPFLTVLPQSALENLLEQRLATMAGIRVEWSHRLSSLETQKSGVVAVIDKLCASSKGYIVRDLDWEVEKELRTRAAFVVGADGCDSVVRQSLGIERERVAEPETFTLHEFESDGNCANEARIVLDDSSVNALWPLTGRRCRWTLQAATGEVFEESHLKERSDVVVVEEAVNVRTLQQVRRQIRERAPWFAASVTELDWTVEVQFESWLAKEFGRDRGWLVGDAAHQTGPVGMQSMNVGLREAEDLAERLTRILRGQDGLNSLQTYNQARQTEWRQLLGVDKRISARIEANLWVQKRATRILPCIPASGKDLAQLLGQVGLEAVVGGIV